jgi:conjugative transfer signal peptidase TraF
MIELKPRRRWRVKRRRPVVLLCSVGAGLLCLAASLTPTPYLIWNASASAPIGLYRRLAGPLIRGDLVLARLPAGARELAAERGYLPKSVPVVKRIAGAAGDTICADGLSVFLNGRLIARRLSHDGEGRDLPAWDGCNILAPDEVFLLMPERLDSYDGRYFGAVSRYLIIGRLAPLWTK